ncbi:thioesterase [Teratosphaeria destructans]|uniref:Thioesterase n=1 Tax=Teratosphaeria destructans TaxID=418781 RepID=A0A9W7VYG3_9PEZI|nr:thioesterase [Teratosphaeria destructans]
MSATISALDKPFLEAARHSLQTHNHSTFARYLAPDLGIVATPSSTSSNVAIRHFEISRAGYEDPPWLRTKVSMFFAPNAGGTSVLMAKCSDGAQTFETYLAALPVPRMRRMGRQESYELQWEWWQARGKIFNFLGLPIELKEMLLLQMVGEVRPVMLEWHMLIKDINAMLQPIIRNQAITQFWDSQVLLRLGYPTGLYLPFRPNLTRIMLDFSDFDYVQFFHTEVLPNAGRISIYAFPGGPHAAYLSKLPNLRYLELWFHPTMDYSEQPWWDMHVDDPHENRPFPCRKGMVDLIMLLAYQYINQISTINMTGYVKTVTRNKWLSIFRDLKNAVRRQEVEHQVEAERSMALLPENCPPKCSCAYPCCFKGHLYVKRYVGGIEVLGIDEAVGGADYDFDFEDDFPRPHEEGSEDDRKAREYPPGLRLTYPLLSAW